jgi:putative ABC transport system ATP-binding protein
MGQNNFVARLDGASKTFERSHELVKAVNKASIAISPGEMVGIVGPSASGKTTLLNLIGLLESPTSGDVFFEEQNASKLTSSDRRKLRLAKVGFVFQQLKLIPTLSVIENVELPLALNFKSQDYQKSKAKDLIASVGLAGKENIRPFKLSVGEQQRVAVARALVNDPTIVLADEPTSQLDSENGKKVIDLLSELRKRSNAAIVVSTHDPTISNNLERVYLMRDGNLSNS